MIFNVINKKRIVKEVSGIPITIEWRSNATQTSSYYHCDVNGIFGDRAVRGHTQLLLRDIIREIDASFNFIFKTGQTGIAFLVTRPLVREVALCDDDDDVKNKKS